MLIVLYSLGSGQRNVVQTIFLGVTMQNRLTAFICTAAVSVVIFFTGCSSQAYVKSGGNLTDLSFWKPNLLYLKDTQCDRLYVELDIVKGSEPDNETIESLQQFLEQYCDKPGGIKIVRDSLIPAKDTNLAKPELLALRYMNGPDGLMPKSTAYLYVLFYDSTKLTAQKYKRPMNPYVRILPYPSAVFIDINYINKRNGGLLREHQGQLLKHEVGHILGLNWSQKASSPWHCPDKKCLMYDRYEMDVLKVLTFQKIPKKELCYSCKEYLNNTRESQDDTNLRFMCPVMVRSERDYHVLSLPGFAKIHFGSLNSVQWQDVLAEAQTQTAIHNAQPDTVTVVMGTDKGTGLEDSAALKKVLATAMNDPCRTVRMGVNAIEQELNRNYGQVANNNTTAASWMKQW